MKEQKPLFGVDLDEVLFDTMSDFLEFYNNRNSTNFKREDILDYRDWGKSLGVTNDYAMNELHDYFQSERGIYIPRIPGSLEALTMLRNIYDIPGLTYRNIIFKEITHKSLEVRFPGLVDGVHFAHHNSNNHKKHESKGDIAKKLELTHYVDDQFETALECAMNNINVYLINAPWNITEKIPYGLSIKRVNNLYEVAEELIK
jgi:hypothetical protein